MLSFKSQKILLPLLAVVGFCYFTAFSNWEINFILKNYAAIMPMQLVALIYIVFFHKK